MSAAVLLKDKPKPTDEDIDQEMSGNICRCGTYQRIRRAIHRAAKSPPGQGMHTRSGAMNSGLVERRKNVGRREF